MFAYYLFSILFLFTPTPHYTRTMPGTTASNIYIFFLLFIWGSIKEKDNIKQEDKIITSVN